MELTHPTAGEAPQALTAPEPAPFVPIAANQRIEALDVVRGFALLGIFLMNIEAFNRYFADIGARGIPPEAQGLDWLATFFVNFFVQGKFWTIFSTLFGMGFAVMLVRAERAGRPFVQVYLRRILGLAVIGAAHYIFIWDGDILFSYSVGALLLMLVLYGRWWMFVAAMAMCVGLGFLAKPFFAVVVGIAMAGLVALYLRHGRDLRVKGRAIPVFSFILLLVGTLVSIAAVVLWLLPDGPIEPRIPTSIFGPLLLAAGWLSMKYHQPEDKRMVRLAVSLYVFGGLVMTTGALVQHFTPDPLVTLQEQAKKEALTPTVKAPAPVATPASSAKASPKADEKPKKTAAQKAAEMKAERDRGRLERETERSAELKAMTTGSYGELVYRRAQRFPEKVAGDFGFGIVLLGMFMLGMWFVRSGVMENTKDHLPLFRRLATWGVGVGIGLSMVSASIATSHVPGERYDGWGIANGLHMLANLPACVGYISAVVLMLHSSGPLSRIRVLAPLGRMALTNYLLQSIVCGFIFYGYGLGQFGMGRFAQFAVVAVIFVLQILLSHWWLARFRYGPMEWLWRGFTYRQVPAFRIAPAGQPVMAAA